MTPKEFHARKIGPDIPLFIQVRDGKTYENRVSRGLQVIGGRDCAVFYMSPMIGTPTALPIPVESIVYICPMELHLDCERRYAEYCKSKKPLGATSAKQPNETMQQTLAWVKANNPDFFKFKPEKSWP